MDSERYCIRSDYRHREAAQTLVGDIHDYWTPPRIARSGDYQRPVYEAAAAYLQQRPGARLADVGCGYPTKVEDLLRPVAGAITLFDQPSMAPLIAERFPHYQFQGVDFEAAPGAETPAEAFDCVVCADVIEHLLDPLPLLARLGRLLRADGRLFLSTPERDALRGIDCRTSPHEEHVREWNFAEFRAFVESGGLQVIEQRRLPPQRLSGTERFMQRWLAPLRPGRYSGCQLVICSRR